MNELDKFLSNRLIDYQSNKYLFPKTELKEWINEWLRQQSNTEIEYD